MRRIALLAIAAGFLAPLLASAPASAQATRTWVSGVGDDANPCSRTAPCKTFAGAISKTATAGEINCLDPGGMGTVTITKSMTINCHDVFGSILASGVPGITINATAAGSRVILRNLQINGVQGGTAVAGTIGVRILAAAVGLHRGHGNHAVRTAGHCRPAYRRQHQALHPELGHQP